MAFTYPNPMASGIMDHAKKVYLGSTFAIIIDFDGNAWSWGFHN
jgi:hypothetical protein